MRLAFVSWVLKCLSKASKFCNVFETPICSVFSSFVTKCKDVFVLQVMETNRNEEAQSHVHRMYFLGPNTFSEPWHLPHSPPEQVKEIVYVTVSHPGIYI